MLESIKSLETRISVHGTDCIVPGTRRIVARIYFSQQSRMFRIQINALFAELVRDSGYGSMNSWVKAFTVLQFHSHAAAEYAVLSFAMEVTATV